MFQMFQLYQNILRNQNTYGMQSNHKETQMQTVVILPIWNHKLISSV